MNTPQGFNSIGLSKTEITSLSKDYVVKNVVLSEKLFEVWKHLEKERRGIFWGGVKILINLLIDYFLLVISSPQAVFVLI